MNYEDKPIACGMTANQWVQLLHGDCAKKATKAIHYLDGEQEEEVVKYLDSEAGVTNWRKRGYKPRYRNITAMIVNKSCRLFTNTAPTLEVYTPGNSEPDEDQTNALYAELNKIEWQEFFINLDSLVRLLKTGLVLVQYDNEGKKLVLDSLHRGNCTVIAFPDGKVAGLIYKVSEADGTGMYRVFTPETITDLMAVCVPGSGEQITVINEEENIWGIVPVAQFYDTHLPRNGFWIDGGQDLVNMNEMVNVHITENEYAIRYMKRGTLFTNTKLDAGNQDQFEIQTNLGKSVSSSGEKPTAGPDMVIQVDSMGVDSPFIDYKTPEIDLATADTSINNFIVAVAGDWSVNVKQAGEASASSGFQLIVEEIDNLELRKQRQRMFEQGFKRLFRVIKTVVNKSTGMAVFSDDAELFVTFPAPVLPVNKKEEMEVFNLKLQSGLASRVTYFMESEGLTREEAELKVEQIDADLNKTNQPGAEI